MEDDKYRPLCSWFQILSKTSVKDPDENGALDPDLH